MPAERLKSVKVQLRLTPLERDHLQVLAEKQQMSMSEFLRWLIHREAQRLK